MSDLTYAGASERLHYEPATGVLTWRIGTRKIRSGTVAGHVEKRGYVQVRINKRLYWGHRVAWLLATGDWPVGEVDHINGNKTDNRFSNLRDVSKSTNMQNLRAPMRTSESGMLGAHFNKSVQKWQAAITVDGKTRYLGLYATAEAAHAVYVENKRMLHQGCTI